VSSPTLRACSKDFNLVEPILLAAQGEKRGPTSTVFVVAPQGTVTLKPLTAVFNQAVAAPEGFVCVPLVNLTAILPLSLPYSGATFDVLPWFAKVQVTAEEASFLEFVGIEALTEKVTALAQAYQDDDAVLQATSHARSATAEYNEIFGEAPPPAEPAADEVQTIEKSDKPAAADSAAANSDPKPGNDSEPAPAREPAAQTTEPAAAPAAAPAPETAAEPAVEPAAEPAPQAAAEPAPETAAAPAPEPAPETAPAAAQPAAEAEAQPSKADHVPTDKPASRPASSGATNAEEPPASTDKPAEAGAPANEEAGASP
jgi:chemotaxis protein histidine kinase CheA